MGSPTLMSSEALASALELWTFDMVQDKMVEAVRIWWRTPGRVGHGSGPYAGDGPWELMVAEAGDWDALGIDRQANDAPIRSAAMTRADVESRDLASDWMEYVSERDRRLVSLALVQLASGKTRVEWMKLKRFLGISIGAGGLEKRYTRAIGGIAKQLNSGKV